MELYIEYVLMDNIIMNYIILKLLDITLGVKIRKVNKALVCGFGAIFSIFLPYLYFSKIILLGYRILVSITLVLLIKKFKKFKNYLTYYALFMAYTFLIGGVCYGVINLLGIEYTSTNLIMNSFEFPFGLLVLILMLAIKLICSVIKVIKKKLRSANYMYDITLIDSDRMVSTVGFFDTGNNVVFKDNGVNIISIGLFMELYKDIDLTEVMLKKNNIRNLKNINYIDISGIGSGEKYLSFEIDEMRVAGIKYLGARIAVAMKNFGDYDCILHRQFVKGE